MMRRPLMLLLFLLLPASPAGAGLVTISELLYDATGSDDGGTFVELRGPPGEGLDGWWIEGINGAGGGLTHRVDLSGLAFPADGFLVLADRARGGGTRVGEADALFANLDFQNGPDSIRLLRGSVVVDALGYGVFGPDTVFAGEGRPAVDVAAGVSLARIRADLDTDDNLRDFAPEPLPTPGTGLLSGAQSSVPEPTPLALTGAGLLLLYGLSRRRSGWPRRGIRSTGGRHGGAGRSGPRMRRLFRGGPIPRSRVAVRRR